MSVVIKEVLEHGKRRFVHVTCPECGRDMAFTTPPNSERNREIECNNCEAKFVITWEETDES